MNNPNFITKVKNNREGQKIINDIKEVYKGRDYRVKLRGRHHDRVGLYRRLNKSPTYAMEVPIEHAEEIAIYVYPTNNMELPKFYLGDIDWERELK